LIVERKGGGGVTRIWPIHFSLFILHFFIQLIKEGLKKISKIENKRKRRGSPNPGFDFPSCSLSGSSIVSLRGVVVGKVF